MHRQEEREESAGRKGERERQAAVLPPPTRVGGVGRSSSGCLMAPCFGGKKNRREREGGRKERREEFCGTRKHSSGSMKKEKMRENSREKEREEVPFLHNDVEKKGSERERDPNSSCI